MKPSPKTLTIRLPNDLYETARTLARRRQLSLNGLILSALEAEAKAEQEARLYDAFGLLGEDIAEAGVEYAVSAQREVVIGDITSSKSRRKSGTR